MGLINWLMKILISLFLVACNSHIMCQNLVHNGDFERNKHFFSFRTLGRLSYWNKANATTPDYFDGPYYIKGKQIANSGTNFCGIGYGPATNISLSYVEYISSKLSRPLIENKNYCLHMYIRLRSEEYGYGIRALNFNFGKKPLHGKGKGFIKVDSYGDLTYIGDTLLRDKKGWMPVCSNYLAKGGEEYLTIGYFNPQVKLVKVQKGTPKYYSTYYYIDDVSLIEIGDSSSCDCAYKGKSQTPISNNISKSKKITDTLQINDKVILDNIYFEENKWELLPQSDSTLTTLLNLMKQWPKLTIEISGFTDNTGNEAHNQLLSENRARAVANFLIEKGISETRIFHKGYGSQNPISDNLSDTGRRKNRRVEFKVLGK